MNKFKETLSRMQLKGRSTVLNKRGGGPQQRERKIIKPQIVAYKTVLGSATVQVDEKALLRDLLFTFQNIDGDNLTYSPRDKAFVIQQSLAFSDATKSLISSLLELSWLYRQVEGFVQQMEGNRSSGRCMQAFCYAVNEELREFIRLIAMLEVEKDERPGEINISKLDYWLRESKTLMEAIAMICQGVKNLKGPQIASYLLLALNSGHQQKCQLLGRVFKRVQKPVLEMTKRWMLQGELDDSSAQFFVITDFNVPMEQLWQQRYSLNYSAIPSFFNYQFVKKVLLTGKAVNFIRHCCHEQEWYLQVQTLQEEHDPHVMPASRLLSHLDSQNFKQWGQHVYKKTNDYLIKSLFHRYKFREHMEAIRKYLLLGQGDFTQYLMDMLKKDLQRPARQLHRHALRVILDQAVRASNAQYQDPDIIKRLDVRLLEASSGDNGWDIFTLAYIVDPPLSTILTPQAMEKYLRIFHFLWKIKRVHQELSDSWKLVMCSKRLLFDLDQIANTFHRCSLLRNEMIHFVTSVHSYIMVEVLESAWSTFMQKLNKVSDLDELIACHEQFLTGIIQRALLSHHHEAIFKQLRKLFELILRFKYTQEVLYTTAQEEWEDQNRRKALRERDIVLGSFDRRNEGFPQRATMVSNEACQQLTSIGKEFQESFNMFFRLLRAQASDSNLRYLSLKLDFNEHYTNIEFEKDRIDPETPSRRKNWSYRRPDDPPPAQPKNRLDEEEIKEQRVVELSSDDGNEPQTPGLIYSEDYMPHEQNEEVRRFGGDEEERFEDINEESYGALQSLDEESFQEGGGTLNFGNNEELGNIQPPPRYYPNKMSGSSALRSNIPPR